MYVYVDGKLYDGHDTIVVVHLTKKDKENIKNMCKDCDLYCEYPVEKDTNKVVQLLSDLKEMNECRRKKDVCKNEKKN